MFRETGSKLGSHTLLHESFRKYCTERFLRIPLKIASADKVVEIDETFFIRRKYNRGRVIEKQWFLGALSGGPINASSF